MLLIGTSLATYSAYRLLKQAHDAGKKVAMLNVGTSRGDDLSKCGESWCLLHSIDEALEIVVPEDMRFSLGSSDVLTRVAAALAAGKEKQDKTLGLLLKSGIYDPVKDNLPPSVSPGEREGQDVVRPQ